MPVLPNPKHEAFAQAIVRGKSASEAYVDAGYKPSRHHASRLATNGNVAQRVAELQGRAAKKAEVTVESLALELEEARKIALDEKQSSAAVSATMGKAKLFGLGVENRRLSGTVQVITITPQHLDGLNDHELAALERAYPILQKLGLIGGDTGAAGEAGD